MTWMAVADTDAVEDMMMIATCSLTAGMMNICDTLKEEDAHC